MYLFSLKSQLNEIVGQVRFWQKVGAKSFFGVLAIEKKSKKKKIKQLAFLDSHWSLKAIEIVLSILK